FWRPFFSPLRRSGSLALSTISLSVLMLPRSPARSFAAAISACTGHSGSNDIGPPPLCLGFGIGRCSPGREPPATREAGGSIVGHIALTGTTPFVPCQFLSRFRLSSGSANSKGSADAISDKGGSGGCGGLSGDLVARFRSDERRSVQIRHRDISQ